MGSNHPYLAPLFGLLVILSPYFISPALSTSRRALIHPPKHGVGFKIGLQHVDYGKNLTKFERLQRAIKRSRHRMEKLSAMTRTAADTAYKSISAAPSLAADIEAPAHAGRGEFVMSLAIGTPPKPLTAIIDTGSDLIWTQCEPCDECFNQSNAPIFNPTKSTSFSPLPCGSELCNALPITECSSSSSSLYNDDSNICSYAYQYGDYSSTEGVLATETFTFNGSSRTSTVSVSKIGFGCGNDNEGSGFNQADGLVGLGRGPLSLVSQLDEPRFAYCLNPLEDKTSALLIGSLADITKKTGNKKQQPVIKTTPLGKSSSQPTFYYVNLLGISVGGKRLPIQSSTFELSDDDGSGGMIIDSGTTITYLEQTAFEELKKEFVNQMKLPVVDGDVTSRIGLEVCFDLPPPKDGASGSAVDVPTVLFHFEGADLDLPPENYMVGSKSLGVVCLAMGGASSGMSILGNVQQFNLAVLYDLREETLSFVPAECDKLL